MCICESRPSRTFLLLIVSQLYLRHRPLLDRGFCGPPSSLLIKVAFQSNDIRAESRRNAAAYR